MATTDLETFLIERLRAYDQNADLSAGSDADREVIQPVIRRVGPDPFTMDLEKFIGTRLMQEYPEVAAQDGDAVVDLLVSPARILMEPLVQEIRRVKAGSSFADPYSMTTEEAEALGANFFSTRNIGDYSRTNVRLYFTSSQSAVVTPSNYTYTSSGLRFLPTSVQSISPDEMQYNREGEYYFFDVQVIAENPDASYNVEPGSITGIYGVSSAVRVTNLLRVTKGVTEESAPDYVGRLEDDITERSLVTTRGILAALRKNFPLVDRVAVVGFGDEEMQRDILRGSGIGPILLSGSKGYPVPDSYGGALTRRFRVDDAGIDFISAVGPSGSIITNVTLTVVGPALGMLGGVGTMGPACADLIVTKVINDKTLEVQEPAFKPWLPTLSSSYWMVRRNELTISGVAGGTDLLEGTTTVPGDTVHIGGMTDLCIRGSSVEQGSMILTAVTDDTPALYGRSAMASPPAPNATCFVLSDLVMGTTEGAQYPDKGPTWTYLDEAKDKGYLLQVDGGQDAATYRVIDVVQVAGASPVIYTDPAPLVGYPHEQRWRLLDAIDVNLSAPKDTKLRGSNLVTSQGNVSVIIPDVSDPAMFGVGKGDYIELLNGQDAGVYTITEDPVGNNISIDRPLGWSRSGITYAIYRKINDVDLKLPMLRIRAVSAMDITSQTVGVTVPLADPVDAVATEFTRSAAGLKIDVRDALVGIISKKITDVVGLRGKKLTMSCAIWNGNRTATFSDTAATLADLVADINAAAIELVAVQVGDDRLGIAPSRGLYKVTVRKATSADAFVLMFDAIDGISAIATNNIRSSLVNSTGSWLRVYYDSIYDSVELVLPTGKVWASGARANVDGAMLEVTENLPPTADVVIKVGPRSVGSARVFFTDPTTFSVGAGSSFSCSSYGEDLRFLPDPSGFAVRYPPPPETSGAKDGVIAQVTIAGNLYGKLTSASVDFLRKGILPGDLLYVDFIPITSNRAISEDPVIGLALTTLELEVDGHEKRLIFGADVATDSSAVTKAGIIKQIERVLGAGSARFTSSNLLEFEPSVGLVIVGGSAVTKFWQTSTLPMTNYSPAKGSGSPRTVYRVSTDSLWVLENSGMDPSVGRNQFRVVRPGVQRTGTTQMASNKTYAGLYYTDVRLISEGTGAEYDIPAGTKLTVSGHESLGYSVSTDNEALSFSTTEKIGMRMSTCVIPPGSSDDLESSYKIAGQNLQITYDWSSVAASLQSYVLDDSVRVTNANLLVRHLVPHYIRFDLNYAGGPTDTALRERLTNYVNGLQPDDVLEAVKIQNAPTAMGAHTVSTPVNLVAVVHGRDRKVSLEQSQDYLNTGRLAGFFVDAITLNRKTA
jgi:hypothetical protein